ncbi:hypothetical protein CHCC20441_0071 [Bacillus licheniformis]|nr:hypothetical protein B4091_4686 [Bacillus licheniformis]KYC99966.1 hypothetical protein B4164_4400 [Bacillus licheniformis]OLG06111.1 hypothetical protein B4124_1495 [Bacillus licheniformis]TWJ42835.1 hypothetical protein CHCC5026_0954 [Bacillus licheniformis]TWJ67991.1 hypothetical protein CHCC5020_1235 [Bacillus licheniformis]
MDTASGWLSMFYIKVHCMSSLKKHFLEIEIDFLYIITFMKQKLKK